MKNLEKYFDHTLLKPDATMDQIRKICMEAKKYSFYAVCINSCHVPFVCRELKGTGVKVASVVGFPLGACDSETKAFEAERAVYNGADEIDMVINIGALKDGNESLVEKDIQRVVEICGGQAVIKVIIETCLLTREEIIKACVLSEKAGAHFVKTSTGFSGEGAVASDVKLMKETVGNNLKVKASGGIRNLKAAMQMIEAGADRIGASASVAIMEELKQTTENK